MPQDYQLKLYERKQQLEKEGNDLCHKYEDKFDFLYYTWNEDDILIFDTDSMRDEFRDVLEFLEEHNSKVFKLEEEEEV